MPSNRQPIKSRIMIVFLIILIEGSSLSTAPFEPAISMKEPVRAIYVSSYTANSVRMKELVQLVEQTELNAMVLDINSGINLGEVSFAHTTPHFTPSNKGSASHYREVIARLKRKNIYLIARITTFKDPMLVSVVPAWSLKTKAGKQWSDRSGSSWIDPYREEAWDYILKLADHAAKLGFDEIQYDYVRFPENASQVDAEVEYANTQNWTKSEAISQFLKLARQRLPNQIKVSADVFGLVCSSNHDMGIGQRWDSIVKEVDIISPMIYPSHYAKGVWGIANPDLSPGDVITLALHDAAERNQRLTDQGYTPALIRPWLQSFTASWIQPHQRYGSTEIRAQIEAARTAGFESYMLWNSSNHYPNLVS